jgi:hypothetical protein
MSLSLYIVNFLGATFIFSAQKKRQPHRLAFCGSGKAGA